jgi:hypothetical protein
MLHETGLHVMAYLSKEEEEEVEVMLYSRDEEAVLSPIEQAVLCASCEVFGFGSSRCVEKLDLIPSFFPLALEVRIRMNAVLRLTLLNFCRC